MIYEVFLNDATGINKIYHQLLFYSREVHIRLYARVIVEQLYERCISILEKFNQRFISLYDSIDFHELKVKV